MGYVQMTLTEWVELKEKLKRDLIGVQESFVRIGYTLRQIEEKELYRQDGYKTISEFAKAEYGLNASTVSRFMAINRKYSVEGYSDRLRPEFANLGSSKLSEMLALPDTDMDMIQQEVSRESIRELKQFNREPQEGGAQELKELVKKFFEFAKDELNAIFEKPGPEDNLGWFREIINPSGNRSYKSGLLFLMFYDNRIVLKKFGQTPKNITWEEFYQLTMGTFTEPNGSRTWEKYFGESGQEKEIAPAQMPGQEGENTEPEPAKNTGQPEGEQGEAEEKETESRLEKEKKLAAGDKLQKGTEGEEQENKEKAAEETEKPKEEQPATGWKEPANTEEQREEREETNKTEPESQPAAENEVPAAGKEASGTENEVPEARKEAPETENEVQEAKNNASETENAAPAAGQGETKEEPAQWMNAPEETEDEEIIKGGGLRELENQIRLCVIRLDRLTYEKQYDNAMEIITQLQHYIAQRIEIGTCNPVRNE